MEDLFIPPPEEIRIYIIRLTSMNASLKIIMQFWVI